MTFELLYTIEQISAKKGHQALSLIPSNSTISSSIYEFEFVDKIQFSLYKNNLKLIEYISSVEMSPYSFKFNNIDPVNNFKFCPKPASRKGYKVTRNKSHESSEINWSWKYSKEKSGYILINKNAQDLEIARISGISLDGQNTGMLYILESMSEDYQLIILFTACIISSRSLINSWRDLRSFLNRKKCKKYIKLL
ncbi:hypothetical protein CONCODRAFT_11002 [Conidiobolus coronatus NRRL 28638]|uniref:Uncharacterized protein n=1 Tax=Conidiobolus coronatus (strain ATCC 28846 / CBS 209.66 / NRRL 28638) TaxID=796925 RepID=A0A137NW22_CONC2|nr:hypothetical protein CONCODRAFT_11002 [Conidiobolus coronatus NRRL 28638]|eukprot:KXN67020.1 hypothetical protein CONCODRAFT_11002 [Conidiobolus coronatus NRRL 28638]